MVYTTTITLAGDALSSFLAAGGQTVNPDATTTAALFPTATLDLSTPSTTAPFFGFFATSSSSAEPIVLPTSSSMATVTASRSARVFSSAPASSAAPTTSATISSSVSVAKIVPTTSSTSTLATSSAVSSSRASSTAAALSASEKTIKPLPSSAIAGLSIGAVVLLGFLLGLTVLLVKRSQSKRRRLAFARSQRERREAEAKSMTQVQTTEVKPSDDFDFGNLGSINHAASATNSPRLTAAAPGRSASAQETRERTAILGIQRPFTPPPGHPAHPNYRPPMQQQPGMPQGYPQSRNGSGAYGPNQMRNITPNSTQRGFVPVNAPYNNSTLAYPGRLDPMPQHQQMPRKPVPVSMPAANPFTSAEDASADAALAAPLARLPSPAPVAQRNVSNIRPLQPVAPTAAKAAPYPAENRNSFLAGDESTVSVASPTLSADVSPRNAGKTTAAIPVPAIPESSTTAGEATGPLRTKSVMQATDQWAQRKENLKKQLALATGSPKDDGVAEDASPFADPAEAATVTLNTATATPEGAEAGAEDESHVEIDPSTPPTLDVPHMTGSPIDVAFGHRAE